MTSPLRTPEDYELFLYGLREQFASIRRSSVTFIRRGASLARVAGELHFEHDILLVIRERIVYQRLPAVIDSYGYEVWRGQEKLYWYDSLIPMTKPCSPLIPITNTSRQTSSTIASQLRP